MMTYISRQRAYKAWREGVGLVGNITALEVTHGVNGWHPHPAQHVVDLVAADVS
ncbi:MAG TPA: hypothetical protein VFN75_03190 [Pseudonocardiaceae bacterium]|nr:hypothetical protein [Pseudonocardiaceae bacterium]